MAAIVLALRRRWLWAAALVVAWPGSAFAVPGPDSTAVLANMNDPQSVMLAESYRQARQIPRRQVCLVDAPMTTDISLDEYWTIHNAFETCLADAGVVDRIEAAVVMRGMPLRVAVDGSETASFTATLGAWRSEADGMPLIGQPAGTLVRCGPTAMCYGAARPNPWGAGPFYAGWEMPAGRVTWRPLLVTMLHGRTYDEAAQLLANAVSADGGVTPGEYLFMDGADVARGVRDADYPGVIAALEERGIATVVREPFASDLTGRSLNAFFTGTASLGMTIEGNTYLPGSIVDNVTSYGAVPNNFVEGMESQVSIARWIGAGAAGVHGTTEEPLNNCFPSRWLIVDYVDGSTLAESYWRRLPFWYWRNLVLGDAMVAPHAVRPVVEIMNVPNGAIVAGAVRVVVRASDPLGRGVDSLVLYIDGVEVARSAGEEIEHCWVPAGSAEDVQVLAVAQIRDDGSDAAFHRPKGWAHTEVATEPGATECAAPATDAGPPVDTGPTGDSDAGPREERSAGDGCGCHVPARSDRATPSLFAVLAAAAVLALVLRRLRARG